MYLRLSLTDRCNLRCVYCLPEQAAFAHPRHALSREQLRQLTRWTVAEAGVRKIRLTGGEPALVPDLVEWVAFAASLVPEVGLTSNGVGLAERLPALQQAGLQRLNISMDAVDEAANRSISRRSQLQATMHTIACAQELGFRPLRVNAVAMQDSDVVALVRWAMKQQVHLRFIELMAIGEAKPWHHAQYISAEQIRERLFAAGLALFPAPELDAPTARVWTMPGVDPQQATVGFITTTSQPFCATCDRLRLTSVGRLHTCLFDEHGTVLVDNQQSCPASLDEAAIRQRIRAAVAAKQPPAQFIRDANMAAIGG